MREGEGRERRRSNRWAWSRQTGSTSRWQLRMRLADQRLLAGRRMWDFDSLSAECREAESEAGCEAKDQ